MKIYPFTSTRRLFGRKQARDMLAREQAMPYTTNEGVIAVQQFSLEIKNGEFDAMQLSNIPADLNGWRVYCRFSNKAGAVDTEMATITVSNGDTAAATA